MRSLPRFAAGLCLAACTLAAGSAHAHPIVSTDVNRHVALRVTDDRVEIRYIYELLEIAAINTARNWDTDGDGTASAAERDAYALKLGADLQREIRLRFDATPLPLHLESVRWELGEGAMGLSTWKLYVRLTARLLAHAATGVLEYRDTLRPGEVGWKEVVLTAGGSTSIARADVPAQDSSYELTDYAAIAELPNPDRTSANAVLRFAGAAAPVAESKTGSAAASTTASTTASTSTAPSAPLGAETQRRDPDRRGAERNQSIIGDRASRARPADGATPPGAGTAGSGTRSASPQLEGSVPAPPPHQATPPAQPHTAPTPRAQPQAAGHPFASALRHYAWPFFKLGVHHIATGYDHLLFLLGLLLLRQTLGRLVAVVTAFTLAHSVTLGLAAAGLARPPGAWIELGIAASIAYVGFIALIRPRTAHGPWIALAFGLVHGFGFAGALGGALDGVAVGRSWLVALASFNLGIEAFQLLVVAALWPMLRGADRLSWAPALRKALALVVLAAGLAWVVARA